MHVQIQVTSIDFYTFHIFIEVHERDILLYEKSTIPKEFSTTKGLTVLKTRSKAYSFLTFHSNSTLNKCLIIHLFFVFISCF